MKILLNGQFHGMLSAVIALGATPVLATPPTPTQCLAMGYLGAPCQNENAPPNFTALHTSGCISNGAWLRTTCCSGGSPVAAPGCPTASDVFMNAKLAIISNAVMPELDSGDDAPATQTQQLTSEQTPVLDFSGAARNSAGRGILASPSPSPSPTP